MCFLNIPDTYYDQLRKRLASSPVKVPVFFVQPSCTSSCCTVNSLNTCFQPLLYTYVRICRFNNNIFHNQHKFRIFYIHYNKNCLTLEAVFKLRTYGWKYQ